MARISGHCALVREAYFLSCRIVVISSYFIYWCHVSQIASPLPPHMFHVLSQRREREKT